MQLTYMYNKYNNIYAVIQQYAPAKQFIVDLYTHSLDLVDY